VSHDSALLRASCDQFVLVADGQVKPFDGDLDDYKAWLNTQKPQQEPQAGDVEKPEKANAYLQKKANRQARIQARRPLLKQVEKLDKQLGALQPEKEAIDTKLADSAIYEAANKAELQELLIKQAALSSTIETLEMEWLDAADYLASFLTFKGIQAAERQPGQELTDNFDMISVYQTFALLVYAFLTQPLGQEDIKPDYETAQITLAKTLFAGSTDEQVVEIIESGFHKFQLIAQAELEHWEEYRENLDKVVVSFVIAGTDDDSPHDKAEMYPILGQLLSQLCEAFEAA